MAKNELPPDLCVEIALWDRFGWGPKDTEDLSLKRMRELFVVLEQQRVSRDAVDNLGPPSEQKFQNIMAQRAHEAELRRKQDEKKTGTPPKKPN